MGTEGRIWAGLAFVLMLGFIVSGSSCATKQRDATVRQNIACIEAGGTVNAGDCIQARSPPFHTAEITHD